MTATRRAESRRVAVAAVLEQEPAEALRVARAVEPAGAEPVEAEPAEAVQPVGSRAARVDLAEAPAVEMPG